jgi:hypothetical protein
MCRDSLNKLVVHVEDFVRYMSRHRETLFQLEVTSINTSKENNADIQVHWILFISGTRRLPFSASVPSARCLLKSFCLLKLL